MLTDEQLTDDLSRAFHGAADDLHYTGRVPRPRRAAVSAVPVLAVAATLVAIPVIVGQRDGAPTATSDRAMPAPSSADPLMGGLPQPRTTTRSRLHPGTIRLAGYQITLDGEAADHNDVYAVLGVQVPADAEPLSVPGDADAFAGTDAETGDAAVFVRVPVVDETQRVFELTSPTLTTDQLAALLAPGNARPVPAVTR